MPKLSQDQADLWTRQNREGERAKSVTEAIAKGRFWMRQQTIQFHSVLGKKTTVSWAGPFSAAAIAQDFVLMPACGSEFMPDVAAPARRCAAPGGLFRDEPARGS